MIAFLDFRFSAAPELDHIGYVYFLRVFEGEPVETEEMEPRWFAPDEFPYDDMWKGDKTWIPELFAGRRITGTVVFAPNNEDVQQICITPVVSVSEEQVCKGDMLV